MVFGYNVNLEPENPNRSAMPRLRFSAAIALFAIVMTTSCSRSDQAAAADATRAQSLFEENRFAEARMAIKDAISERDDEPQYHILRGRIEYAINAVPQAYDAYSNALALDPSNMEALQAVSQLGLQTGHLRESLDATDTILSLAPNDITALLTRGLHSIVRSRFDEASSYADKILSLDPSNEGGAILKSRALFRKGQSEAALAIMDRYSSDRTTTVGIAMTRLEIYRALGSADGMRAEFRKLRELAPENDAIRIDEANFAFKDGRPSDGLSITSALLANPKLARDQVRVILDSWQEYSPSGPAPEELARIAFQGSPATRTAIAAYLIDKGLIPQAESALAKVEGADRVALNAAIALKQKQWARALQLSENVLSRDKSHCLALTVRSSVMLHADDLQGAIRSAQEAASQCPDQTSAWELAATSYSRRGDFENAKRMWRQGMEANRQNSQLASSAARWLEANGKGREAISIARRLTHDAPALVSGWKLYVELCERNDTSCTADAKRGLAAAERLYGIDLLPGQPPPNGLFGRIVTR